MTVHGSKARLGKGLRLAAMGWIIALALAYFAPTLQAAPPKPLQKIDAASAAPRPVEESTAASIDRDYAHAWQSLILALDENRADLLNENFTGVARQQWQGAISAQRQSGLRRRIVDHGHTVQITFYSLDGSALEAVDLADLEIQYCEGSKILHSEHVQARYLVLLTPAENSWKVRILQEVPAS